MLRTQREVFYLCLCGSHQSQEKTLSIVILRKPCPRLRAYGAELWRNRTLLSAASATSSRMEPAKGKRGRPSRTNSTVRDASFPIFPHFVQPCNCLAEQNERDRWNFDFIYLPSDLRSQQPSRSEI